MVESQCVAEMDVLNVEVFDGAKFAGFQCTRFSDRRQLSRHSVVVDGPCGGIEVFHVVVEYETIDDNPIDPFPYHPSHPSRRLLYCESPLDHDVHMVRPTVNIATRDCGVPECIGIELLSCHCLRIRTISCFRQTRLPQLRHDTRQRVQKLS